ncbi:MAG: GAF domain-containing protein [Candidatus Eremiobacteraeota bacterium]|nr:GAF domain-containing protein [Candidatus Eremiobacteraeota bacterium]MCW5870016.1 GAF domain-containing protein [Candidatus Eremiobacteraeota bacterium]
MTSSPAAGCNQNSIQRYSRNLVVFLGILTVLTLGCGFQALHLRTLQEGAARDREEALLLSDQLALGSDRLTSAVRGYAASGDKLFLDEFHRELERDRNREVAIERLKKLGLTVTERDLLQRAKKNSDELVQLENQAIAWADQGQLDKAVPLVFGPRYRQFKTSIMQPIQQFRDSLRDRYGEQVELLSQEARDWAAGGLSLLVLNSLATGAVLTLFFWRRVVQPLTSINGSLRALLTGQKNVVIGYQEEASEVGDIARSLERYRQASDEAERQRWMKNQLAEIADALHQAETPEHFAGCLLSKLVPLLGGGYGAFYCWQEQEGQLRWWGGFGGAEHCETCFDPGQGLVGQCQLEQRLIVMSDLPDGYVQITSGSGAAAARSLVLIPVISNGETLAVVELAAFHAPSPEQLEILEAVSPTVCLNLEILQRNLKAQKLAVELQGYRTSLRFSQEQAERLLFSEDRV